MNDIQVECFLSVAETMSFTNTALELNYTQQAVSKNIRDLEHELNTELFSRSNHEVSLTSAGEYYRTIFSKIRHSLYLQKKKSILREVENSGKIRIAISARINRKSCLVDSLIAFKRNQPNIDIECIQGDTWNLLESGRVDVAFVYTEEPFSGNKYKTHMLAKEKFRFIVSNLVEECRGATKVPHNCWGIPYIEDYAAKTPQMQAIETIRRKLARLCLEPPSIELVQNIDSLCNTLLVSPCATIGGIRFGITMNESDIQTFALPETDFPNDTWIAGVWRIENENPFVQQLLTYIHAVLKREDG